MAFGAHGLALLLLAAPHALKVDDRSPLALVLATPTGQTARTNNSEIIRRISEVIERHTDLEVVLVEERAVERCRGRLYCLADEARPDYSEESLRREDGGRMTYREHLHRLKEEGNERARLMLLVTNVAMEGEPDRVSAVLVDTDTALRLLHDTAQEESGWQERLETAVSEQAVVATPPRLEISDARAAEEVLEQLVVRELRKTLEAYHHWEPWGTVALEVGAEDPLEIAIDDRTVGTTVPGRNELLQVSPGERRIRLRHPSYEDAEVTVRVEPGKQALVEPALVRTVLQPTVLRPITAWSGLVLALSGAAIAVFAVVRQDKELRTFCFDGAECSEDGFVRFGYAPDAVDAKNVNPSGVLMAPLGYSIATVGAVWSLGTVLFGDADDVPWIQWVAGLALGAAAYGVSAALGG